MKPPRSFARIVRFGRPPPAASALAEVLLITLWLMLVPAAWAGAPAGAAPITVPFDHLSTGFELDGVHRDLPCESCHLNAIFKGTPRNCGVCHITGSTFNATPKTMTHIRSTNNCAACHDTISFRPDVHFNHQEVMGSCVACHNGTIAQGEGPTHPATSQACEACHTTMAWNPPKTVDHTQIPLAVAGFCIICHNGVQAAGKPNNHIPTRLECGDCHLTTNWLGATFDHTGILTGCVSCHNGVRAVGKQGNHMPTTTSCENCHTTGIGSRTPSWAPSGFDHTQMTVTTCQTCHSGTLKISTGVVSGQPANHVPPIPSLIDCGVCHGNSPTSETWKVLVASIPTLHSGLAVTNCLMCHAGQTFAGVPAPYVPMSISGISPTKHTPLAPPHIPVLAGSDCSACHGAAYQAGGFGPATAMSAGKHAFVTATCITCHETGKSFYVGGGTPLQVRPANHFDPNRFDPRMASSDCSVCHETTDWNSTALPVGHMPNPANLACSVCHIAAPTNYTTLAVNAVLHTGINGGCGQCHGAMTALIWYKNFTPKAAVLSPAHIPYLAGTDCSSCHSSSTYAVGGFGPNNMSAAKHAFVPTTCDTCHDTGRSFYLGASTPALQLRPADHLSSGIAQRVTGDCSGCHETTDWNSQALPAGHMPNPGNQGCAVCHVGNLATQAGYATMASIPVLHTGITTGCAQCHGGTTQLTFYNNNDNPKAAASLSLPHIPAFTGNDCSACHAPNYVAGGFGPMNMTQATHTSVSTVACTTCHEVGLAFYMGAANPGLQGRPANHNTGAMVAPNACSNCHTTANWLSGTLPPGHMPNPGNQGCSVCHIAAPSNYAILAGNTALHTGIAGGCIACHGAPNATPPIFANGFTPKSAVLSPVHIPTGATPCEDCHQSNVFTSFSGTSMSSSKHSLMFGYVSGSNCDACHNRVTPPLNFYGVQNLQTRPNDDNHSSGQAATADCSNCHRTDSWGGNAAKKKTSAPLKTRSTIGLVSTRPAASTLGVSDFARARAGVAGSLLNARSAGTALGAGAAASAVLPRMSHLGVTSNCASCHNGVLATGKGATHIASNTSCENCHTTFAWLPARYDHQGVTAGCTSCHNGVQASGKPMRHIQTNQDCSACHGKIAWQPALFSHAGINATCQSCHNGITATAKQFQHVPTTLDCGTCHNTLSWTIPNSKAPLRPLIQRPKPTATPGLRPR